MVLSGVQLQHPSMHNFRMYDFGVVSCKSLHTFILHSYVNFPTQPSALDIHHAKKCEILSTKNFTFYFLLFYLLGEKNMTFREVIITHVSVIQKSYLSYYKRLSQRGMYTKFSFSSFFYAFLVALTGRGEIEIRRIMQTCQAGDWRAKTRVEK